MTHRPVITVSRVRARNAVNNPSVICVIRDGKMSAISKREAKRIDLLIAMPGKEASTPLGGFRAKVSVQAPIGASGRRSYRRYKSGT